MTEQHSKKLLNYNEILAHSEKLCIVDTKLKRKEQNKKKNTELRSCWRRSRGQTQMIFVRDRPGNIISTSIIHTNNIKSLFWNFFKFDVTIRPSTCVGISLPPFDITFWILFKYNIRLIITIFHFDLLL